VGREGDKTKEATGHSKREDEKGRTAEGGGKEDEGDHRKGGKEVEARDVHQDEGKKKPEATTSQGQLYAQEKRKVRA
jgi:hypothetical protein